jgi:lysophospholipid acyltransferase (LPLAT)-like uncharacterized protein
VSEATRARKVAWGARLGTLLLRALAGTWRVRVVNRHFLTGERDRSQPVIYVLWHGDLLPLLWTHRNNGIAVMISEHSDGEIIARIAKALRFRTVRGSTSRGAARALLAACSELEDGHEVAITVDGPRGPAGSVAPGALVIGQRTRAPLLPVAAYADRAWRLRSWDRFMIPKPFARVTVAYDTPIRVASATARDATEEADQVRAGIHRAGETAAAQ